MTADLTALQLTCPWIMRPMLPPLTLWFSLQPLPIKSTDLSSPMPTLILSRFEDLLKKKKKSLKWHLTKQSTQQMWRFARQSYTSTKFYFKGLLTYKSTPILDSSLFAERNCILAWTLPLSLPWLLFEATVVSTQGQFTYMHNSM